MISKELFVNVINNLKEKSELENNISKLIREYNVKRKSDFPNEYGLFISFEEDVIKILEEVMKDNNGDISYFIYELNFGRDYVDGCVNYIVKGEKTIIDLSTPEKLYDYLSQNM